jgi:hypothetical protein
MCLQFYSEWRTTSVQNWVRRKQPGFVREAARVMRNSFTL